MFKALWAQTPDYKKAFWAIFKAFGPKDPIMKGFLGYFDAKGKVESRAEVDCSITRHVHPRILAHGKFPFS